MNSDARERLWNKSKPYVQRVLMAKLQLDRWYEKEDLINDCLSECWVKLPKFRGDNDAELETFLVTVARNHAFGILRKRYGRQEIATTDHYTILQQPWVTGAHDALTKEEKRIISAKCKEPSVQNFR